MNRCTCGRTFEHTSALINHLTTDHMDEAPEGFAKEWLVA